MKKQISPELQAMIILCQAAQDILHGTLESPGLVGLVRRDLWKQSSPAKRCELLRQHWQGEESSLRSAVSI